jgi:DNA-directed RNA polymerase specialized sigma24 family protein
VNSPPPTPTRPRSAQTGRKQTPEHRAKNPRSADYQRRKRSRINDLVTEFLSASPDRRLEILWGDGSDAFVSGAGLVGEFEGFLRMYASIVKGVRPEKLSSHSRQMMLYRETEISNNGCLRRVLESMDEEGIFHDLIFVFTECILHYDPDRTNAEGKKQIQFVGYLNWNFKFYTQKWLQRLSQQNQEDLAPDEALALVPVGLDGTMITARPRRHPTVGDEDSEEERESDLPETCHHMGLQCIEDWLHVLTLREQQVVSMRYIRSLLCQEVAEKMLLTKGEVIKMTQAAFTKIREERERREGLASQAL